MGIEKMVKTKSIRKNYIMNTLYQVFALILPLVTTPYVSRIFGAEGIGIYSYTSSIAAFFTLFAILGRSAYGQRVIAQCRDDIESKSKNFWEIEILSVVSSALCILIWLALAFSSDSYRIYFLVLTIELVAAAFDISWFYAGLEDFSIIVLRNVLIKSVTLLLLFTLIKEKDDLVLYIFLMSFSKLLGNISMWISLKGNVKFVKISVVSIKRHFCETLTYFVPVIAASVYTYLDKLMINWITGSSVENGYYEQTQKIVNVAYTIVISLNTVMASRISYLFQKHKDAEIKEKLEKALAFILTLAVPMVFGIIGISDNFVPWFFGQGYDKVALLLKIEAPLVLILSAHNFLSAQYLVPSGQRKRSTKAVFIGAGVNFCLNMLLIPRLMSLGAIIASVIGECSIMCIYMYMSREYIPVGLIWKYVPQRLVAGVLMTLAILPLEHGASGSVAVTVVQILFGGVIYFTVLVLLKDKFILRLGQEFRKKFIR